MIYEISMDNGRQLFINAPTAGEAHDYALRMYPGAAVTRLTAVAEVTQTDTTDATGEDE